MRRGLLMKRKSEEIELEWIYLGTSVNLAQNIVHAQTGNVDFAHPIYGLAFLKTGSLCTRQWGDAIRFSYAPCSIENTYTEDFTAWSVNCRQRASSTNIRYNYLLHTNSNKKRTYDVNGNVTEETTALATSLPDTIVINGNNTAAKIDWISDEPYYLLQILAGVNDLSNFAILVDKNTVRTQTQYVWKL